MWGKYTYIILDLIAFCPVLFLSFDKWVQFYKKWKISFLAIIPVAIFFIVWDVWFTNIGVWEFNAPYLLGLDIINLPLEEWLFFIAIPLVTLFMAETIKVHFAKLVLKANLKWLYYVILVCCIVGLIAGLIHNQGYYTVINFALGIGVSILHLKYWSKSELDLFGFTYLVHLIPFALVNGVLTSEPVVIYNAAHNLGIRFTTIPIEDFFYSYNMIGLVFLIYFKLQKNTTTKAYKDA
jgi:lycopene cyclase domain-containing protein